MAARRDDDIQALLDTARRAFDAAAPSRPPASAALAERVFSALEEHKGEHDGAASSAPAELPACVHLAAALDAACAEGGELAALARAVAALRPRLTWVRRPGAEHDGAAFADGHANTWIIGPDGLERRRDVVAGMSLLAPGVRYPDHRHPPEEFYVVLSRGEWRQRDGPWHEPGPGGVVHNPPGIVHAMRAGGSPLLALWFLWNG